MQLSDLQIAVLRLEMRDYQAQRERNRIRRQRDRGLLQKPASPSSSIPPSSSAAL